MEDKGWSLISIITFFFILDNVDLASVKYLKDLNELIYPLPLKILPSIPSIVTLLQQADGSTACACIVVGGKRVV